MLVRVEVTDGRGMQVFDGPLWLLPLREDVLARKCMELYGKAELCAIRHAAVKRLLHMEISDRLSGCDGACVDPVSTMLTFDGASPYRYRIYG